MSVPNSGPLQHLELSLAGCIHEFEVQRYDFPGEGLIGFLYVCGGVSVRSPRTKPVFRDKEKFLSTLQAWGPPKTQ